METLKPQPLPEAKKPWPHAPTHQLATNGTFIVNASTHLKAHHFRGSARLEVLQRGLLTVAHDHGWALEAWAVFSNHYHFVAHAPADAPAAENLGQMLKMLHAKTANWVNRLDGTPDRQTWYKFFETRLTYPNSYLARLHYIHRNPVKHGLVPVANQYPWCSAAWFERTASPAQVKTIYDFKTEKLKVFDEFEPAPEW